MRLGKSTPFAARPAGGRRRTLGERSTGVELAAWVATRKWSRSQPRDESRTITRAPFQVAGAAESTNGVVRNAPGSYSSSSGLPCFHSGRLQRHFGQRLRRQLFHWRLRLPGFDRDASRSDRCCLHSGLHGYHHGNYTHAVIRRQSGRHQSQLHSLCRRIQSRHQRFDLTIG